MQLLLLSFARQWVAGAELHDAIRRSEESNASGIGAIINHLGEHYVREKDVEASKNDYLSILGQIAARRMDACISVKPTQLGLSIGEDSCRQRLHTIRDRCSELGVFLWIDMEGAEYTSDTLRLYRECLEVYPETGLALQANLRRTEDDLRGLLPEGGIVRLCKGAYREAPSISYRKKRDVDASYVRLMRLLFREGERFALATHDDRLIVEALRLQEEYGRNLEFQMLLGVRDALKADLRTADHRVLEYIPYGPKWLPYFSRRLSERPRNILTMWRSFLAGG